MKLMYEKVPRRENSSFFAYKRLADEFEFNRHCHPEYEIVAITSGFGKRYIAESISDYKSPELVLLPPNIPHSWQSDRAGGNNCALVVQFSRKLIEACALELDEFAAIADLLDAQAALSFDISRSNALNLLDDVIANDGVESFANLLLFLNLLCGLEKSNISTPVNFGKLHRSTENINHVFNYINQNFTGSITLADAARQACMSQSAFCRAFKNACGSSFITYLNDLRIAAACRMLADTDKSITQICCKTGFGNIANFNRQFKKRKKQSPRQYKQQFLNTQKTVSKKSLKIAKL